MRYMFPRALQGGLLVLLPLWLLGLGLRAEVTEMGQGAETKYEVQLIWATNDKKSPNPEHKPVEPEIRKKLDELPLRWENYFEVNRKEFSVSKGGRVRETLSEKCAVEIRDLDGKQVEVKLFDKAGKAVLERRQPLPKGEILLVSGNAPAKTAWFVAIKPVK